jgi:STE24 endopeptidase
VERILLLLPVILSLTFRPEYAVRIPWGVAIYLGTLLALVALTRVRAMSLARRSGEMDIESSAFKLGRLTGWARTSSLFWTAAGLYVLGWRAVAVPRGISEANMTLVVTLLVTWPAYLAWGLLYWAQYPAERAVREQAMVEHLNAGIPSHPIGTVRTYLDHQLRSGLGQVLAPTLAAIALKDVLGGVARELGVAGTGWAQALIYVLPAATAFAFAPVMLRHVLRTRRLPEGALRVRLSGLAQRTGVSFSEVLVWDTRSTSANAMVMGIIPGVRYVLLSDLLIQSMPDEEIEAVFAHELGHIVHRHTAWYVAFLFFGALLLEWLDVPARWLEGSAWHLSEGWEAVSAAATFAILLSTFGAISRRFEKQADVFAARSLPSSETPLAAAVEAPGAAVFGQALQRVAMINNMSVTAPSWTHGSISSRVESLLRLAEDAGRTFVFDRRMWWVRVGIAAVVVGGLATGLLLGFQ